MRREDNEIVEAIKEDAPTCDVSLRFAVLGGKLTKAACDQLGDEIVGFAVVAWDQHGDMRTAYDAARGPIGPAPVPTSPTDALNRHVAVKLAEEWLSDND